MVFDYIIIGAGASGCICAIEALKKGKKVLLIEHKDRILKKVLVTGNGRCNFTNKNASFKNYYGNNKELIKNLFKKYDSNCVIKYFEELGILAREEAKGKMYPNSMQASSIVDAIRNSLEYLGVTLLVNTEIEKAYKKGDIFYVNEYKGKKLVISTGGCSYKQLGSDGSGYDIAKSFGHTLTKLNPVLVQLMAEKEYVKGLEGIRQDVDLKVYKDDKLLRSDFGELLFTPYGISGPTIFNTSYLTALYGFDLDFVVDFMPEINKEKLKEYLLERRDKLYFLEAVDFLNGVLHKKLGMFLLKKSGLDKLNIPCYEIKDKYLDSLVENIKAYKIKAYDTMGFKQAQVTAGGIDSDEVDISFQSKIHKNLYFIGEVLDIFGDCGGYNLQFAFASGLSVGSIDD